MREKGEVQNGNAKTSQPFWNARLCVVVRACRAKRGDIQEMILASRIKVECGDQNKV